MDKANQNSGEDSKEGLPNKISQEATNTSNSAFLGGSNYGTLIVNPSSAMEDLGIIANIFGYVIENIELCKDYDKSKPPKDWVKTVEKIKINFKSNEFETIKFYYKNALPKLEMIKEYYQTLDSENQSDLHSHLFEMYNKNKMKNVTPIENIHLLFEGVTPTNYKSNTQYTNMAKALVLFFFEDCTIFERSALETIQISLW